MRGDHVANGDYAIPIDHHYDRRHADTILFDEERDELIDFVREAPDSPEKMQVLRTLESTTTIVAAQVLFGTGNSETTLARLDPLWAWLFDNRAGLLQADGEGYYHRGQLLLDA